MQTIYDVVGEDGFQRLVHAFYRQVPGGLQRVTEPTVDDPDDLLSELVACHAPPGEVARQKPV